MNNLKTLSSNELRHLRDEASARHKTMWKSHEHVVKLGNEVAIDKVEDALRTITMECLELDLAIACDRIRNPQVVDLDEPGGHDSPAATAHLDNPDGEPGFWKKFIGESIDAANYDVDEAYTMTNAGGEVVSVSMGGNG